MRAVMSFRLNSPLRLSGQTPENEVGVKGCRKRH